jgi:hypothetical protein
MSFREFPKNKRETVRVAATVYEGHDLISVRGFCTEQSER